MRMEDSPPSSLSSRHSHEDDEDKMPEEAFMKYTKDSRAGSPAPPTTAKVPKAPSNPLFQAEKEEAEEKTQIKVDLRESQDSGGAGRKENKYTFCEMKFEINSDVGKTKHTFWVK